MRRTLIRFRFWLACRLVPELAYFIVPACRTELYLHDAKRDGHSYHP